MSDITPDSDGPQQDLTTNFLPKPSRAFTEGPFNLISPSLPVPVNGLLGASMQLSETSGPDSLSGWMEFRYRLTLPAGWTAREVYLAPDGRLCIQASQEREEQGQ